MIHFKDYETMPKFVEVMPRILQTFFACEALIARQNAPECV